MRKILLAVCLFAYSITGFAFSWSDLWSRTDEQAAHLLAHGKAAEAATKFEDLNWKSTAYYRAGNYDKTVDLLKSTDTPLANYNRGNALAHLGQYEAAITAYDQVLKVKPDDQDAKYNRDLLKKLLQQQKRQQHSQSGKQQQKNSQQQKRQQKQSSQNSQHAKTQNNSAGQQTQEAQQLQQQSSQHSSQQPKDQQANQDLQQQKQQQKIAKNNNSKPQSTTEQNQQQAQQQAAKQWLRRVPDDPGGLLRQKFLRDYLRSQPGDS